MKRFCLCVTILGALVLATAAGADAHGDSVVGGGINALGDQFSVSAHSGPLGEDPTGHVELRTQPTVGARPQTFHGNVKDGCLIVVGNRAVAVGRLPQEQQYVVPGGPGNGVIEYAAVAVEDNGGPVMGQPTDRAFPVLLFSQTGARVCAGLIPATFFSFPLVHGNVLVEDSIA